MKLTTDKKGNDTKEYNEQNFEILKDWINRFKNYLKFITVYFHHNDEPVFVLRKLKGKHRKYCLCHYCGNFHPGKGNNCKIAQKNYELCKRYNITSPVWECPDFSHVSDSGKLFLTDNETSYCKRIILELIFLQGLSIFGILLACYQTNVLLSFIMGLVLINGYSLFIIQKIPHELVYNWFKKQKEKEQFYIDRIKRYSVQYKKGTIKEHSEELPPP